MAAIETDKFQNMVSSIGADTIQAIATAGPEMQVNMIIIMVESVVGKGRKVVHESQVARTAGACPPGVLLGIRGGGVPPGSPKS